MAERFRDSYSGALILKKSAGELSQEQAKKDMQDLLKEMQEERKKMERLAGGVDNGETHGDK